MIAHVVMFRPRPDVSAAERETLAATLRTALREIPSVRRVHVGRRVRHGRGYEQVMRADFPFAAILEFDDLDGLKAYLQHPAHEQLGAQFFAAFEEALMYDYEMAEGEDGIAALV